MTELKQKGGGIMEVIVIFLISVIKIHGKKQCKGRNIFWFTV